MMSPALMKIILLVLCNKLSNGSDHKVTACYLPLYEESEVKHINIICMHGCNYQTGIVFA